MELCSNSLRAAWDSQNIFPKTWFSAWWVMCERLLYSEQTKKTPQSQISPDNRISDPNAGSMEVITLFPGRQPGREQERGPVPKTCQTLDWGGGEEQETREMMLGQILRPRMKRLLCDLGAVQTLQCNRERVVRKWIIFSRFLPLAHGEQQSGGVWGLPAGVSAWMFSVPFTTCLLLSRRHLLALWVRKRREPLEMVDGLERRHPLSCVAVSAVLGRRRERQDKALQAGRKGCACVRRM